ncbi:wHTH domain-containing protein [Streptomyces sp. SP18CS02]|uniref:wHTH domain-containing protein n=1 Tax=Streptomyces sp. SP18CS02 TaxID=3002531 RepID=UPI002E75E022|nr:caspase family protein [Streptomyces sp. SP18CS02]MEE1756094.1 caspase family protein [Streptomyces sp. SP18CS02]
MGAHRALLLFVPEYEKEDWADLAFLRDEYEDLAATLVDQGYEIDEPDSGCEPLRATELVRRVERFIAGARRGEHLLVFLSGHGFEHDGKHWFAGTDSEAERSGRTTLTYTNVDLDGVWGDRVHDSDAEAVLFVVDACRDRVLGGGGPGDPLHGTPRGTDRLGYLMACEPARKAAVGGTEGAAGGRYSLFTRALQEVLADVRGPLTAGELRELLVGAMEDLRNRQQYPPPPQTPVVSGDGADFGVLPGRDVAAPERERLLREHPVWDRVDDRHEAEDYRAEATRVLANLDEWLNQVKPEVRSDLWLDWEADQRAARHLSALIAPLPGDKVRFTPSEAALLALAPALFHAFRVRLAWRADPDLRDEWTRYPRLRRQTDTTTDPRRRRRDRQVVGAWVLHRARARPGDAHDRPDELRTFLRLMLRGTDELTELGRPHLVSWLFRAMQHGGGVLADPPTRPAGTPAPDIRPDVVGFLLCAAQIMALDLADLPPVLVEHIGGSDRIGFAHVRRTVEQAEWVVPAGAEAGGIVRLLAVCGHPALMAALQEQAKSLDALLCSDLDIRGKLPGLPSRASEKEVRPEDGKFFPVVTRFGLDGSRVRELLIGEQLYQDKNLAVRELYQNAMDACRVRDARVRALPPTVRRPEWTGHIEIVQGVDGNRPYLECVDNGSGMGRRELLGAFAQGGVRLAHLPSFQEEKLHWEREGIQFEENSRFGIGVLSYFMLADEIEVVTRKFNREGHEDEALRVTIAGPDHLFQVTSHKQPVDFNGDSCGTRVRWWLRDDLPGFSGVRALRSVLGVAEYRTVAVHRTDDAVKDREVWERYDYRPRLDTGAGRAAITAGGTIVPDEDGQVFWCSEGGALLVDGIAIEGRWFGSDEDTGERRGRGKMELRGAVINLRGKALRGRTAAPRLSVDRARVLDDLADTVFGLVRKKNAAKRLADSDIPTPEWLFDVTNAAPRLADAVVEGLIARGARLHYDDGAVDMARTGFFTDDVLIRRAWSRANVAPLGFQRTDDPAKRNRPPAHIALWRYVAHFPEGVGEALGGLRPPDLTTTPLRAALPSDGYVLGDSPDRRAGLWDREPELGAQHLYANDLNVDHDWVVERLRALGREPSPSVEIPGVPLSSLLTMISRDADGLPPWLRPGDPVKALHVLLAIDGTSLSAADAVRHLDRLGFDVRLCEALAEPASRDAEILRLIHSQQLNASPPWTALPPAPASHIVSAAKESGLSVAEIRSLFEAQNDMPPQPDELRTHSGNWVVAPPDPDGGPPRVGPATVYRLAKLNACRTGEAALLLEAHGHEVVGTVEDGPVPPHAALLTTPLFEGRLLDLAAPVTLLDLDALAAGEDLSLSETRDRLRSLCVDVPEQDLPAQLDRHDRELLTRLPDRSGTDRTGLDPRHPVPMAHIAIRAAQLGIPVETARDRLVELGMAVEPADGPRPEWFGEREERRLSLPWIPYDPGRPEPAVPVAHLVRIATDHGWSMTETAERLRARGLRVPDLPSGMPERPGDHDLALLSQREVQEGERRRWLRLDAPAPTRHVVQAAGRTGMTIGEVRSRLAELGVVISGPGTMVNGDDRYLALDDDSLSAVLRTGRPVPAAHLWASADLANATLSEVADRTRAAGLDLQDVPYPDERPEKRDLLLLQEGAVPNGSWLPLDEPVGLEHLLVAAHRLRTDVLAVAERLRWLGMDAPSPEELDAIVKEAWAKVPRAC